MWVRLGVSKVGGPSSSGGFRRLEHFRGIMLSEFNTIIEEAQSISRSNSSNNHLQ